MQSFLTFRVENLTSAEESEIAASQQNHDASAEGTAPFSATQQLSGEASLFKLSSE